MSLAGTGGTAEESEIKRSAAFRWPFAAPVDVEVTSYTVGVLRLFDPFLADFSGSLLCHGVESWEFTTFHNVCAKPENHLRTQPLSRFVKGANPWIPPTSDGAFS